MAHCQKKSQPLDKNMKGFVLGILITLLMIFIAFEAYQFGKDTSSITSVTPTPSLISPTIMSPTATPTIVDDNALIEQALFDKNKWQEKDGITIQISTDDGKYASGTVTSNGGGGYFYAAKVNGVWKIVADGNGLIFCSNLINYPDYPKILIPECYDQATSKSIKR